MTSIAQVCEWVNKSWENVWSWIIVKSFKKCGISNVLDGTQDNVLFEHSDINSGTSSSDEFLGFDEDFSGFEGD